RRRALISDDVVVAHSGEIVVGLVVFPHVVEAEVEVLTLLMPALGGAIAPRLRTALPLAGRRVGSLDVAIRIDADAVEIFRIQVHHADYGRRTAARQGTRSAIGAPEGSAYERRR